MCKRLWNGHVSDTGSELCENWNITGLRSFRIIGDAQAAESARALNAKAYTLGQDVIFGTGQYTPGISKGRRLMAHELTHVMQQSGKNKTQNKESSE